MARPCPGVRLRPRLEWTCPPAHRRQVGRAGLQARWGPSARRGPAGSRPGSDPGRDRREGGEPGSLWTAGRRRPRRQLTSSLHVAVGRRPPPASGADSALPIRPGARPEHVLLRHELAAGNNRGASGRRGGACGRHAATGSAGRLSPRRDDRRVAARRDWRTDLGVEPIDDDPSAFLEWIVSTHRG
jgi:hypothetical protein